MIQSKAEDTLLSHCCSFSNGCIRVDYCFPLGIQCWWVRCVCM